MTKNLTSFIQLVDFCISALCSGLALLSCQPLVSIFFLKNFLASLTGAVSTGIWKNYSNVSNSTIVHSNEYSMTLKTVHKNTYTWKEKEITTMILHLNSKSSATRHISVSPAARHNWIIIPIIIFIIITINLQCNVFGWHHMWSSQTISHISNYTCFIVLCNTLLAYTVTVQHQVNKRH